MKKAVLLAFDYFTDIDIFLAWDLLNRVKLYERKFEVKIVGTKKTHNSVSGIDLAIHSQIETCSEADLVFFGSGPGTRSIIQDHQYLS